jgi:hypothetical protein
LVLTKQLGVLVANIVVFERNLGVVEERGSKDKSVLALIKNKQRLVIHYAPNIDLNILAGFIKRLGFL